MAGLLIFQNDIEPAVLRRCSPRLGRNPALDFSLLQGMPATTIETLALHLVRALYDVTEGGPQAWRSLAGLGEGSESADAVQYAVDRGWLMIEGGHSVCLTDAGRRRAQV